MEDEEQESDESEQMNCSSPKVSDMAKEVIQNLLTSESKMHYEKVYNQFL